MKKLKTALILLFALVMSLCLFACGGGGNEGDTPGPDTPGPDTPGPDDPGKPDDPDDPDGPDDPDESEYADLTLSEHTVRLTDSDGEEQLLAEFEKITATATEYNGYTTKDFKLTECKYDTSVVKYHTVGEYTITVDLEPSVGEADTLTVVIDHDWEEEGGVKVCQYDNARMEETTEDVTVHFGTFHEGIYPSNYAAAKAAAGWTEADAYTNKNVANSKIQPFGEVNGLEVPSLTAGQLEPGMTITIYGTAKTQVASDPADSPWNAEQKYWNSPSLGIADRNNTTMQNPAHPTYDRANGVSVIVRQEGWVLYNGVGTTATNRLGGIMGGFFETTSDWRNYGSHSSENDTPSPSRGAEDRGYSNKTLPTDWSKAENWWVWSTGEGMDSGKCYGEETDYAYSWYYRLDGVIEITYLYNYKSANQMSLKAYIKVPDAALGYYDTLIQGDYNDMTITKTEIITTSTPKENGFKYNGVKSGAQTVYAENMDYDASALNITVEYVQDPGKQNPVNATRSQVYRYIGTMTRSELEANSDELYDNTKWESLGTRKLELKSDGTDYIYKVQVAKSGVNFAALLGENDLKVKPNSVDSALGSDVTIGDQLFKNNGKVGDLAFSFDATNVVLTLNGGYAQKMTAEQKTALGITDSADYAYVALRLNKADGIGDAFETTITADNATVKATISEAGDLYLVVALKAAAKITLTGAQDTPILLDLSGLKGFTLISSVTSELTLNGGGDVTLTYTVPANTKAENIRWTLSSNTIKDLQDALADGELELDDYTLKEITYSGTTLTIKLTANGLADLSNYVPYTFGISIEENGAAIDSISDTVEFDMALEANEKFVESAHDNYFAFVTEAGKLNIVRAFPSEDLQNGTVEGVLKLNLNNGDFDAFAANGLLTIEYALTEGELVLKSAPDYVTGYAVIRGTFGDNRDTDIGAYIVITVDVADEDGLAIDGDYYFEVVGGTFDPETAPKTLNKVSGTAIAIITLDNTYETEIFSTADGTCYEEGLYGWQISKDGKVICFANVASAGGDHIFGDDGVCVLCGATPSSVTTADAWTWYGTHTEHTLAAGDIVETKASFKDSGSVYGNGLVILLFEKNSSRQNIGLFVFTALGDVAYNTPPTPDGDIWLNRGGPHADVGEFADNPDRVNNPHITEEHPYNTFNGALDKDGNPIETASISSFMEGGQIRYIVTHYGDTIQVTMLFYTAGQTYNDTPQYQETYTVKGTSGNRYEVWTMGNDEDNTKTDNKRIDIVLSKLVKSEIEKVEAADVDGHTSSGKVVLATAAAEGEYDVIKASGTAETAGDTYYTSFKITFKQALVNSTSVKLVNADGEEIEGGKAILAGDKKSVEVYLPIASGLNAAYLDFSNYEANTKQSDIKIDLSDLIVSSIASAVSGTENLTIAEGTFTVTYTGAVQATDTLVLGEASKLFSEITEKTDFGNGYSAQATIGDGTTTVAITKAAAELTKAVAGITVRLERNGSPLAIDEIEPAVKVTGGTQVGESGWSATASGTTLILFSNNNAALELNVNAGKETDLTLINNYDISLSGAEFAESNALTRAGKVICSTSGDTTLYVLIFDLTSFGVTEETPYGYQVKDADNYYAVAANRAITSRDAQSDGEKEVLAQGNCLENGIKAYKTEDESFYYGLEIAPGEGHAWAKKADASKEELKGYDELYECSNECGAKKYVQNSTTQEWGSGTAGKYNTWPSFGWEKFGTLYKGGSYTISGLNLSNEANVWDLNEPGLMDPTNQTVDGFRIDNYVQNDSSTLPWPAAGYNYSFYDNKTQGPAFPNGYSFDAITAMVKTHLDNATVTYSFDWTKADQITISMQIVNEADELDLTVTVAVTGIPADAEQYDLAFHVDGNLYTASGAEIVVPAGKEPATALTKHVHDWSQSDKCECGEIHSEHGTSDAHPHIKGEDNVHCSICGAVMEHEHKYNSYYVCEYCGAADNASIAAMAVTDQNMPLGAFGTGDWWTSASGNMTTTEGDFLAKITFSQGTSVGITGAVEIIYTNAEGHGDGYLTYNPMDSGHWGGMITEGDNAAKATLYEFGTKPSALTNVTYEVYVWRIGTTMVVDYRVLDSNALAWEQVIVVEGVETQALNIHINGYTVGYTELKGYMGTITAKA